MKLVTDDDPMTRGVDANGTTVAASVTYTLSRGAYEVELDPDLGASFKGMPRLTPDGARALARHLMALAGEAEQRNESAVVVTAARNDIAGGYGLVINAKPYHGPYDREVAVRLAASALGNAALAAELVDAAEAEGWARARVRTEG